MSLLPYSILIVFLLLYALFGAKLKVWSVYTTLAVTVAVSVPVSVWLTGAA